MYLKENISNAVYTFLKLDVRGEVWLGFLKPFRVPYYLWICCKLNTSGFGSASPYFVFFFLLRCSERLNVFFVKVVFSVWKENLILTSLRISKCND